MIILELYKLMLGNFDLANITYAQDVILCGGVCLCLLLDVLISLVIFSILVKLITKRNIVYWMNKIIK